jgi:hypothetical protein
LPGIVKECNAPLAVLQHATMRGSDSATSIGDDLKTE